MKLQPLEWADAQWEDPNGGMVHLHGVLPCVVYPRQQRPRENWDGLALIATSDEPQAWMEDERLERESPGISLADALLGGGLDARYLDSLLLLDNINGPNFPDPEPRRLHLYAEKNDKGIYFVEPRADSDQEWLDLLERQAMKITHPWKLFKLLFQKGRYRRIHLELSRITEPVAGMEPELFIAGSLAGSWWIEQELRLGEELATERDARLAGRIRGALADLRNRCGKDEVVLLLPHHLARRNNLLRALEACTEVEDISCASDDSAGEEE